LQLPARHARPGCGRSVTASNRRTVSTSNPVFRAAASLYK